MSKEQLQHKELLALLRSGKFTVAYHDNGHCCIYNGKYCYDDLPEKEVAEYDYSDAEGYLPDIVKVLVQALGGWSETI
jgi:hypothetical protein